MNKIVVKPNNKKQLDIILNKDIYGIIFPINTLSLFSNFTLSIDEVINIKTTKKKIILLNKIMHEEDLNTLDTILSKVKKSDISHIMFYDMAVYEIAKKYNIIDKLVIYQEHLNRSINSNNFYYNIGIKYSYISSDITKEEIKEIKDNTNIKLFYTVYGKLPIFSSKRKLITNYLEYINNTNNNNNYTISNNDSKYIIKEENNTVIYSECINLINKIKELEFIDYIVIDLNMDNNIDIIDKFKNKKTDGKDYYLGFYNTKTIFKVKK